MELQVKFADPFIVCDLQFETATKTKPIKAKPLVDIVSDSRVLSKVLLNTLEGNESVTKQNAIVCLGEAGDVWQQTSDKLLKKYSIVQITEDGWLVCDPKPENEVWATKITEDVLKSLKPASGECPVKFYLGPNRFAIFAQWGTALPQLGEKVCYQTGDINDFVLQSKPDPDDVWIVKNSFFNSTYEFK